MVMYFYLSLQNSRKVIFGYAIHHVKLQFLYLICQQNFAVKVVTMHTLVYGSHVEYDKNNDNMIPK